VVHPDIGSDIGIAIRSSHVGTALPTKSVLDTVLTFLGRSRSRQSLLGLVWTGVEIAIMSQGIAFLMGVLGLGMWHSPAEIKPDELDDSIMRGAVSMLLGKGGWDVRRVLVWLIGLALLCLMGGLRRLMDLGTFGGGSTKADTIHSSSTPAILSTPTENSFRSYLTELSFRKHLRDLHHTTSTSSTPRTAISEEGSHPDHAPTPFRFSNHVAITLRTPNYIYRTFHVLSLVCILPSPERTHKRSALVGKNGTKHARRNHDDEDWEAVTLTGVWFIGAFGKWWCIGSVGRSAVIMLVGGNGKGREMVEKGQGVVGVVALPDAREDVHQDGEWGPCIVFPTWGRSFFFFFFLGVDIRAHLLLSDLQSHR
jgi:hypothetical protein